MNHNLPDSSVEQTVCRNPSTGDILGHSPLTSVDDLKQIIISAREAQKVWSGRPVQQRVKYLLRIRDYISRNADEISEVIAKDNGKTRMDALSAEVMPAVMALDYYAKKSKRFLKDRYLVPGNIMLANKISKIIRVPYGVIGIISPWNYPFGIPFSEVVMGLLAGNAIVLKCATETQMVGRKLEECFREADLPQGVFSHVNIPGKFAGSAMLKGGIDKLFFTGSVTVGKQLMKEASETLTQLVLELGGNDAMLVCADADLHRAVSGAVWAGFSNCGQSCGGVERIYVHTKIYDAFLVSLKAKVEALRVGPDEDFNTDLGAMTTDRQIQKVNRHIEDALAKGASVYARTPYPPGKESGHFMPAYVLTDVNHDMLVMGEETFGPVLSVMEVKDMDEAVVLANDSNLGLTGSVWSQNPGYAEKLGRKIQAGVITINDHLMSHGLAETPWGGFKASGIGRTHGAMGFDEMTQPQVMVHDFLPFARQNIWWHPHSRKIYEGLMGLLKFLYGKTFIQRGKGLINLIKLIPRYFSTQ